MQKQTNPALEQKLYKYKRGASMGDLKKTKSKKLPDPIPSIEVGSIIGDSSTLKTDLEYPRRGRQMVSNHDEDNYEDEPRPKTVH